VIFNMTISLDKISKRFNREWIFRDINFETHKNSSIAIIGPNGSGKSTLLQIIAGNLLASSGNVTYSDNGTTIPDDKIYQYISFTAPYLDIIEEFTLDEFLKFHFKFKKLRSSVRIEELPEKLQLNGALHKEIKNFSTGMRQRVKLGITFFSDAPVMLLDEPTTNLDLKGLDWYYENIEIINKEKIIFVSSNSEKEYSFCREIINVLDYK